MEANLKKAPPESASREARVAAALRDNLLKRKAQAETRGEKTDKPEDKQCP